MLEACLVFRIFIKGKGNNSYTILVFNETAVVLVRIWSSMIFSPISWDVEDANCNSSEGQDPLTECPGYDTKLSDGEVPVLKFWGMWNIPLLPLFPGSLWHGMIIPVRVPSMGQIEIFDHFLNLKPFNYV